MIAYEALRNEIPDFDKYENKEQIIILSHADWYLKDNTFVPGHCYQWLVSKVKKVIE